MFIVKWLLWVYITLKSWRAKCSLRNHYHLIEDYVKEQNIQTNNISRIVNRDFTYVTDPLFGLIDTLTPLDKLFQKRTGDCDDINWLVSLLFDYLGTKTYFVTVVVVPYTFNHSTCIIKPYSDRWMVADYGALSGTTYISLEDAVKKLMQIYADELGVHIKVKWIIVQTPQLDIVDIIRVK